jgi:Tol biopolymer transport system component
MRTYLAVFVFSTCLGAQASVPRYVGPVDSSVIRRMPYRPVDRPLVWQSTGDLVISHVEFYSYADMVGSTCEGTGVYRIAPDGTVTALATGRPLCDPHDLSGAGLAVDRDVRWIVRSSSVGGASMRLVRFDLGTLRVDTLSTECSFDLQAPAVSPDGRRVVVLGACRYDDRLGVFIAQLDSTPSRRLTPRGHNEYEDPAWSPDGARIAVVRNERVAVMDTSGKSVREIARGRYLSWSPDGQWIAFVTSNDSIHVIHPGGAGHRVIFVNQERGTYGVGFGSAREGEVWSSPVWSPDGSALAFSRSYRNGTSIWRLDVATGALRAITAPAK